MTARRHTPSNAPGPVVETGAPSFVLAPSTTPDRSPPVAPRPGEAVAPDAEWGSFKVLRPLGRGGMGTVYEAWDTVLDRPVALKVLAPQRAGAVPVGPGECLQEARAAAKLDHPNIVTVYQVGEHAGVGFIAMQLVRGGPAVASQPRTVRETTRIVRAVASALGHAHRCGLVHRDVKPENVLLGGDGTVKLADFGLAQVRSAGASGSGSEKVSGTPAFMSPEQAQGRPLDGRSDLYALGATWFALLTGRPPFQGSDAIDVLFKHLEQPPPDVRGLRPDVPAAIARLIDRLLAKQPADRPATAEEVVAAIDAADRPAEPAPAVAAPAPRARGPQWVLIAALLGTPLGIGLALAGSMEGSTDAHPKTESAILRADLFLSGGPNPDAAPNPAPESEPVSDAQETQGPGPTGPVAKTDPVATPDRPAEATVPTATPTTTPTLAPAGGTTSPGLTSRPPNVVVLSPGTFPVKSYPLNTAKIPGTAGTGSGQAKPPARPAPPGRPHPHR